MSNYKDIVCTIGTYLDKSGTKKYVTRKVGTLLETDKGMKVKLDASFNPAGCLKSDDGSVWLSCFDPKPRDQARQAPRAQSNTPPPPDDFDDWSQEFPPF